MVEAWRYGGSSSKVNCCESHNPRAHPLIPSRVRCGAEGAVPTTPVIPAIPSITEQLIHCSIPLTAFGKPEDGLRPCYRPEAVNNHKCMMYCSCGVRMMHFHRVDIVVADSGPGTRYIEEKGPDILVKQLWLVLSRLSSSHDQGQWIMSRSSPRPGARHSHVPSFCQSIYIYILILLCRGPSSPSFCLWWRSTGGALFGKVAPPSAPSVARHRPLSVPFVYYLSIVLCFVKQFSVHPQ